MFKKSYSETLTKHSVHDSDFVLLFPGSSAVRHFLFFLDYNNNNIPYIPTCEPQWQIGLSLCSTDWRSTLSINFKCFSANEKIPSRCFTLRRVRVFPKTKDYWVFFFWFHTRESKLLQTIKSQVAHQLHSPLRLLYSKSRWVSPRPYRGISFTLLLWYNYRLKTIR